jgi:hypothetical protein
MNNFLRIFALLAVGLTLSLPARAASSLDKPIDPSVIILAGGFQWVWAGPCATLEPSCGTSVLRDDFKIPTAAQWLSSFADTSALVAAFAPSNQMICGSPWFNSKWDHCDLLNLKDGIVWGAPSTISTDPTAYYGESFLVRAVPEPETYAMLLGGLGLLGAIARRRKQS